MRIKFYSQNADGKWVVWKFSNINELLEIYISDFPDLPANDDPIRRVFFGDEPLFFENVISNPTFYDLVKLLGIVS